MIKADNIVLLKMKDKFHRKVFIGPMTLNVVDSVVNVNNTKNFFGLVPSRRQVECSSLGGGYVNGWNTLSFMKHVGSTLVLRDHAGPGQGLNMDDGLESLKEDIDAGLKFIHIDPWKKCSDISEAIKKTAQLINFCLSIDPSCHFEVGTESAIYPYKANELELFLSGLEKEVGDGFSNIVYGVVQSGTQILGLENIGSFNLQESSAMCDIVHKFGLLAKEHNSDYLTVEEFKERKDAGVDSFNIAPEFGVLETKTILGLLNNDKILSEQFQDLAYNSRKWEKWVNKPPTKIEAATICGHYVLASTEFANIRSALNNSNFDNKIKEEIVKRLKEIVSILE